MARTMAASRVAVLGIGGSRTPIWRNYQHELPKMWRRDPTNDRREDRRRLHAMLQEGLGLSLWSSNENASRQDEKEAPICNGFRVKTSHEIREMLLGLSRLSSEGFSQELVERILDRIDDVNKKPVSWFNFFVTGGSRAGYGRIEVAKEDDEISDVVVTLPKWFVQLANERLGLNLYKLPPGMFD